MGENSADSTGPQGKGAELGAEREYSGELRATIRANRSRITKVATGEIALVLAYVLLPLDGSDWVLEVIIGLLAVVIGVLFIARRGLGLERSDTPMLDAALAASWMLVLLVVGFAAIYFTMANHGGQVSGLHTKIDGIYFTVTTLGTVGFGDIVATSQAARAVVALQIVFNLTFVAVGFRLLMGAGRRGVVARAGR